MLFETELKSAQGETKTAFTLLDGGNKSFTTSNQAMVEILNAQISFLAWKHLDIRTNNNRIDASGQFLSYFDLVTIKLIRRYWG